MITDDMITYDMPIAMQAKISKGRAFSVKKGQRHTMYQKAYHVSRFLDSKTNLLYCRGSNETIVDSTWFVPPPLGKKFGERNFVWDWYKMKVKQTD